MTSILTDVSTVTRTETVRPAMCGHNSLFAGQIGDWTWDAVGAACDTDVLNARDPSGSPTYLSFYYYRIRGSRRFHLRTPSFGDKLHITTQVYDFGSESVLALHKIERTPGGEQVDQDENHHRVLSPEEFYAFANDNWLYVENFNRWVTRSDEKSNQDLVKSSPVGFTHAHLPKLPNEFSPRHATHRARTMYSFLDHSQDEYLPVGQELTANYHVDLTRDLNGVGLLYFASYFSILDWALLKLWRKLGRDDKSFLDRIVVDQQLCYLGNADYNATLTASAQLYRRPGDKTREFVNIVLRDGERVLAVCTLQILGEKS